MLGSENRGERKEKKPLARLEKAGTTVFLDSILEEIGHDINDLLELELQICLKGLFFIIGASFFLGIKIGEGKFDTFG